MHYYLKLKAGKSIQHPLTKVIMTEGVPSTTQPVLFIQNQRTTQTTTGFTTSFYILMYNSLADKINKATEFYSAEIVVAENVVAQNAIIQIPESLTEVNIVEATQQQLYIFLLNTPVMVANENGVQVPLLDENNNPVMMFGDWELATQE